MIHGCGNDTVLRPVLCNQVEIRESDTTSDAVYRCPPYALRVCPALRGGSRVSMLRARALRLR